MTDPKPSKRPKLYVCKVCRQKYEKGVLHTTNPLASWCSVECATKLALKRLDQQKVKQAQQVKKDWTEKKKVDKESLKTLGDYNNDLQTLINTIIRNIDTNFPCISSNKTTGQDHAGHFHSRGSKPSLRFNLFNIWKQSAQDNAWKGGNIHQYLLNLNELFGEAWVDWNIVKLPLRYPLIKLSVLEIKEKILICRQIVKEQKNGDFIATTKEERVAIRAILQEQIGIY